MGSTGQASKLRDALGPHNQGLEIKVFVRDVRDRQGRKRPLTVRPWSTVKDVKDQLQHLLSVPPSAQRLFLGGPLQCYGRELPNHWTLNDAGICRSGETLLFDIREGYGGANQSFASTAPMVSGSMTPRGSFTSFGGLSDSLLSNQSTCDVCISSSMLDSSPKPLRQIVQKCRRGLLLGFKPELGLDGSGGTYFMHDARKVKIGVFKPADEEPYAENNPRGYVNAASNAFHSSSPLDDDSGGELTLRAGIQPGEACLREVAAFLLDRDGFNGVPMTTLVEARHPAFHISGTRLKVSEGGATMGSHSLLPSDIFLPPQCNGEALPSLTGMTSATQVFPPSARVKIGSLQEYIHAECSMDDLSPSKIGVDEVHKIAILDIRLMNADRNLANLLCRRRMDDSLELVPIDHGYCLRSVCDVSWFDWCWLDWPQLKKPLSKKSRDHILALDIEADVRVLKEMLDIREKALDFFRASSKLLQAGVKAGLTLYEIALMCCRHDDAGEVPSRLELLATQASELATCAVENGRWHHAAASRALAEQLVAESPVTGHSLPSLSPSKIFKSKSSANFGSNSFGLSESESFGSGSPPASTQTSGSDSSSEADDGGMDHEECEEWAAGIIADVSIDVPCLDRRTRSISDASSSSSACEDGSSRLSSSPTGFWYTRPGTQSYGSEESISWSPSASPRTSLSNHVEALPNVKRFSVTFDNDHMESDSSRCVSPIAPTPSPLPQLETCAAQSAQPMKSGNNLTSPPGIGMVRSQSYSAFSVKHMTDRNPRCSDVELSRINYLKFVDLLIVRETLSAANRRVITT